MSKYEGCPDRRQPNAHRTQAERRSGTDRRGARRLSLSLETAVPVLVRGDDGFVQWGIARNVSEGGMLIEIRDPPGIGARLEIQLSGVPGSSDAPEAVILHGEIRHQVAWNYGLGSSRARLSAIGVRFVPPPIPSYRPTGELVH